MDRELGGHSDRIPVTARQRRPADEIEPQGFDPIDGAGIRLVASFVFWTEP